jgi:hypothetical protein
MRKRKSSFDQKNMFLHPKTCIKMSRSISNASSYSENSEDLSFGLTSSNLSSFEDLDEEKPRKRSLTTRSSKDIFSKNNSDLIEEKQEVKNEEIRSTGNEPSHKQQHECGLNDSNFIWMEDN